MILEHQSKLAAKKKCLFQNQITKLASGFRWPEDPISWLSLVFSMTRWPDGSMARLVKSRHPSSDRQCRLSYFVRV